MTARRNPTRTSPRTPSDEFPDRVRKALAPLLADDMLIETTALKIQREMARNWKFTEHSSFFDFQGKVDRVVTHFENDGLTRDKFVHAATRRFTLFFQNPDTLIANIEGVVEHFQIHGLTRSAYLSCAVKQPQLFYQKPRTLISNIERVVEHFTKDGLTCADYLCAAMKQPSLFFRKPETIILHVNLITGLYRKGILKFDPFPSLPPTDAAPVLEYLVRNPQLFLMAKDNIALRETYARATNAQPSRKILLKPRRRIERELAEISAFQTTNGKLGKAMYLSGSRTL
jgi:hypothetical protein